MKIKNRKNIPIPGREKVAIRAHGKKVIWQNFKYPGKRIEPFLLWSADKIPVIVLPVTREGNIIFLRQYCHGTRSIVAEFPGGCIEPGQSAKKAALEELRQEAGYAASKIIPMTPKRVYFEPHNFQIGYIPVLAAGCRKIGKQDLESNEVISVHEVSPAQWISMVRSGDVKDSKTIAMTLLASLCFNIF